MEEIKLGLDPHLVSSDGVNNDYQRIIAALQAPTSTLAVVESDPVWPSGGVSPGMFTITRTGRLDALTIAFTFGGDAIAGTDYLSIPGTITLPFGMNSVTLQIAPLNGAAHSLALNLSPGSNYQIGTPASTTMSLGSTPSGATDTARFLTQATFGPAPSLLTHASLSVSKHS